MIEKWTPTRPCGGCAEGRGSPRRQPTPACRWSSTEPWRSSAGDRPFLEDVLGEFLGNVRRQMLAIRQALDAGDAETVRREAHSIKAVRPI